VRVRFRTPLVTLWVPVNVWLSSVLGLPEEPLLLLPHAVRARLASTTTVKPPNTVLR
jgi:hypothetical protein